MATTSNQTHSSENSPLTLSFNAYTDFTTLADYCERFADAMIESDSLGQQRALCYRLAECLNLLFATVNDPIPAHLIESLTVDVVPETVPRFEPESEDLCRYCFLLAQILSNSTFAAEDEKYLAGLLYELVCYFADELRAPRFIRTANGVKPIDEIGEPA